MAAVAAEETPSGAFELPPLDNASPDPFTIRIAAGFFGDASQLLRALSALGEGGLASGKYCIIGGPGAKNAGSADGCGTTCRAEAGAQAASCTACAASSFSGTAAASWLRATQSRRLREHLARGGLVLIVSSGSPAEQDATSRILLRHSRHGVQTHDFTIARSGPSKD